MALSEKPYLKEVVYKKEDIKDKSIHPFNIPCLQSLDYLEFHADVTFIVGENGVGKSTLIEAIALSLGLSAEGGTQNFNLETAQTTSNLHKHLKLIKSYARPKEYFFLRAESFYNLATYTDEINNTRSFGGKSLHEQSHGESFFSTIEHKLRGNGLYLFDEPEAALSPQRQLATLSIIHELVQKKSQFIIATHSPLIMAYPNAKIIELTENGFNEVTLEETSHYQTYDLFFKGYKRLINQLIQ